MTEKAKHNPSYYVAIGASAGGLEALQEFFQHMPTNTGVAFIVIQHLSPDFKSVMDELLGRCTGMKIFNAMDGVAVQANTVYLIPPRKNMMIAEGKLLLVDQMPDNGLNFPIDIFFRSLAEDQHHRSIGIILSGTGSDGSRGLQAIKEVGGLVMTQEPNSAKFDGMPYSAVKTGLADVIERANVLPEKLVQYITHPMIQNSEQSLINQVKDSDSAFQDIFTLLRKRSDIDFTQYKPTTVARRIERRIGVNGLSSLKDYHELLLKRPHEIQTLAKDMLIGVTRFFRDDEAFKELETTIIPNILAENEPGEPVRIWVAGCSTGEEAYSIAIIFDEAMRASKQSFQVKIFATDVDPDAIAEAGSGQFGLGIKDDIGEERADRYFTEKEGVLTITPHIRQMVVFATHNLINDPPFSNTHLAVCRNVLIYFQSEAQKRVLSMLHFSLRKDGYLFLGASESLGEIAPYFDVINDRNRIYRKTVTSRLVNHSIGVVSGPRDRTAAAPSIETLLRNYQNKNQNVASSPMTETLINDYVPACIVLNHDLDVIHGYGDVSPFTKKYQTGAFSSHIKNVIIDELSIAVSTAVHRATTEEDNVTYENICIEQDNGSALRFNLRVRYVKNKALNNFQVALVFEAIDQQESSGEDKSISYNLDNQSQQRINDLELELQKNQEHLQVTIEELETTNEELQSSNEELLAANEELQSTNEELQSVNEELYTVNSEYQEKIEEITNINTDLDNIMKSTDIGILFLDDAMLIRNFTPALTREVNILKSDIGRPFHHISHKLKSKTLLQDIANVIENAKPVEKELKTQSGNHVLLKITSYVNELGEKYGCVLSITDITENRQLHGKLKESFETLETTLRSMIVNDKETLNILVVDDNEADLDLVKQHLYEIRSAEQNYKIDTFTSFESAKEKLESTVYDACFIDYKLDHQTAFDLLEDKKAKLDWPPCILLSGYLDDDMYKKALKLGIYEALDKADLTPRLLERTLKHAIHVKKIKQYLAENSGV